MSKDAGVGGAQLHVGGDTQGHPGFAGSETPVELVDIDKAHFG